MDCSTNTELEQEPFYNTAYRDRPQNTVTNTYFLTNSIQNHNNDYTNHQNVVHYEGDGV